MKKLFYLFLLLPLFGLIACDDDNDLPQVDLTLTLSGVTLDNESFYTVSGNEITIEGISTTPLNGKPSSVQNVIFYFDGVPLVGDPGQPFMGTFSTEGISAGTHSVDATGYVLQEGSPISNFAASFDLVIVETAEDLPVGAPEIGEYSQTIRLNPNN